MLRAIKNSLVSVYRCERGTAALEMTLVTPLLMFMAVGVVDIGRLIQHHHVASKSVRDASRYIARTWHPSVDTTCPVTGANWTTSVNTAKTIVLRGSSDGTAPPLIPYWTDPNDITVTMTCFDNSAGTFRQKSRNIGLIRVSATVPFTNLISSGLINVSGLSFSVSHEQIHIGQ